MHVVFFGPGFPQAQQRYLAAIGQFSVHITGLGEQPVSMLNGNIKALLDDYIQVRSLTDETAMAQLINALHQQHPIDRIIATYELHIMAAAWARSQVGIAGLTYEQARLCRDKVEMKAFMHANGIPCATTTAAQSWQQVAQFAEEVGYPIITKPRDGAGSAQTFRIDHYSQLQQLQQHGVYQEQSSIAVEEFIEGHEGTYDTLTLNGEVVCDFVTHYYPNLMQAHHDRRINPINIATNQLDNSPGYQELRALGRQVSHALQLAAAPTHMEWFSGPKGLKFSEIAVRPPGADLWDLYCMTSHINLYHEWARMALYGHCEPHLYDLSRHYAAGIVSIRPNQDGHVVGYEGLEWVHDHYGQWVVEAHFPEVGHPTRPIDSGFKANAWLKMRHPDYDTLKDMMHQVANTIRMLAA